MSRDSQNHKHLILKAWAASKSSKIKHQRIPYSKLGPAQTHQKQKTNFPYSRHGPTTHHKSNPARCLVIHNKKQYLIFQTWPGSTNSKQNNIPYSKLGPAQETKFKNNIMYSKPGRSKTYKSKIIPSSKPCQTAHHRQIPAR